MKDILITIIKKQYHAFVLGLLVSLGDTYEVLSNRESGYGRYDVCIIPRDLSRVGIIIEFKKLDLDDYETMEEVAKEALEQIEEKQYRANLEYRGVNDILELAIVFRGKEIFIKERI